MNFYCYILFSQKLNKFYTGSTSVDIQERLEKHLKSTYSISSFTHKADDWTVYLSIRTETYEHARKLESKIKSQKSSKYIRNLKNYPELLEKILNETIS